MKNSKAETENLSDELLTCVDFHGHLCPGMVYGYIVAKEFARMLGLARAHDEEIVAVCENKSCAVDAFQTLLGTTTGKGNLIINNWGKNAYTIFSRSSGKAYRFSRINRYSYDGEARAEFKRLEKAVLEGTATAEEKKQQKRLKSFDLVSKPFEEVFTTREVEFSPPPYAELASSKPCARCGEMTMSTKMILNDMNRLLCVPCAKKISNRMREQ